MGVKKKLRKARKKAREAKKAAEHKCGKALADKENQPKYEDSRQQKRWD